MKTLCLVGVLAFCAAALSPARAEFGLGPPFTHIVLKFVSANVPQEGVTAVLVDGSNQEHQAVSGPGGKVVFTVQALSGNAYLTFWKEGFPPARKALPYSAGNHYYFCLEMPTPIAAR